jgi:hypothetical protein
MFVDHPDRTDYMEQTPEQFLHDFETRKCGNLQILFRDKIVE